MKKFLMLGVLVVCGLYAGRVDIKGINKKKLVKKLYLMANPVNKWADGFVFPDALTDQEAAKYCKERIEYLKGRVMKIDISGDEVETEDYNVYSDDTAENIIHSLRKK